jgi:hypothetical protein
MPREYSGGEAPLQEILMVQCESLNATEVTETRAPYVLPIGLQSNRRKKSKGKIDDYS